MKAIHLSVAFALAIALSSSARAADASSKISGVHLCCKGCVTGAEKAVTSVPNAKAEIDADAGTVTISGPDTATVQKGAAALLSAGYFGKTSDSKFQLGNNTGAKDAKVQTLKVEGVHLCCGKCVKAVDKAVKSVDGVKEHDAVKGAKSFNVTGDFNEQAVFTALQKEGLTGNKAN